MHHPLRKTLIAAFCGLGALAGAHAATLDIYTPPASNMAMMGLSSGGAFGVVGSGGNDYVLDSAIRTLSVLPGGFGKASGISADARWISAVASSGQFGTCKVAGVTYAGTCDLRQAAVFNMTTNTWQPLGSLGYQATSAVTGGAIAVEQSTALAISGNGQVVAGTAWAQAVPGSASVASHPAVFRAGAVLDLNAGAGTSQTGKALSVNGDGSVVTGYVANAGVGSVWTWNGSGYSQATAPKVAHPATGVLTAVAADKVSGNGTWVAGGSVNALAINYGPTGGIPAYTVTFSQATLWNTVTGTGLLIPFDHVIDTTNSSTNADIVRNTKATVNGVSDSGVVIGSFNLPFTGAAAGLTTFDTWIYNANGDGKSQTFDAYLRDLGLGLSATQHVNLLFSMSADGSAISGQFFDTATQLTSSFVLHTSAVPEPASWALFVVAAPLLAWFLRRRRRA